jgi:hypothetical protein
MKAHIWTAPALALVRRRRSDYYVALVVFIAPQGRSINFKGPVRFVATVAKNLDTGVTEPLQAIKDGGRYGSSPMTKREATNFLHKASKELDIGYLTKTYAQLCGYPSGYLTEVTKT